MQAADRDQGGVVLVKDTKEYQTKKKQGHRKTEHKGKDKRTSKHRKDGKGKEGRHKKERTTTKKKTADKKTKPLPALNRSSKTNVKQQVKQDVGQTPQLEASGPIRQEPSKPHKPKASVDKKKRKEKVPKVKKPKVPVEEMVKEMSTPKKEMPKVMEKVEIVEVKEEPPKAEVLKTITSAEIDQIMVSTPTAQLVLSPKDLLPLAPTQSGEDSTLIGPSDRVPKPTVPSDDISPMLTVQVAPTAPILPLRSKDELVFETPPRTLASQIPPPQAPVPQAAVPQPPAAQLLPQMSLPPSLLVNVDEVLRLGAVMERQGMPATKKAAFDWIAMNRASVYKQPRTFSAHLMTALGNVEVEKTLAINAVVELRNAGTLTADEYSSLVKTIEVLRPPITTGQLAYLVHSEGGFYKRQTRTE